jgi:hypothetical protein
MNLYFDIQSLFYCLGPIFNFFTGLGQWCGCMLITVFWVLQNLENWHYQIMRNTDILNFLWMVWRVVIILIALKLCNYNFILNFAPSHFSVCIEVCAPVR